MVAAGQRKRAIQKSTLAVLCGAVLLIVSACTQVIRNHGYIPLDSELELLTVGADTRGSVEDAIGRPSTVGVLEGADWFYVGSRIEHFAWRAPKEIDRQVVAISFGADDVVTNIERFGLENGQVVTLSRRVTETTVRDVTFIRQIIRNFGRIDLGDALDN